MARTNFEFLKNHNTVKELNEAKNIFLLHDSKKSYGQSRQFQNVSPAALITLLGFGLILAIGVILQGSILGFFARSLFQRRQVVQILGTAGTAAATAVPTAAPVVPIVTIAGNLMPEIMEGNVPGPSGEGATTASMLTTETSPKDTATTPTPGENVNGVEDMENMAMDAARKRINNVLM